MSVGVKLLQAAAGNAGGGAVYVDDVFSTFLYQGTSSNQDIVNGLDLSGEGGLVWVKGRPHAGYSHNLYDTARGVTKRLASNENTAESTYANSVTAFNNNGFSLGSDANGEANYSGSTYVSWSFRKAEKFFDIVTYTGDGTTGRSVAHNLGSAPGMILIKNLSAGENWVVYHRGIGNTKALVLNSTAAEDTSSGYWNNTDPTATHFTLGNASGPRNENGVSYLAYLFAHDEQEFGEDSDEAIINCGSYTGTGSAGNSVTLGFEPQWLMIKQTSGANDWYMYDTMRGIASGGNDAVGLKANSEDAEGSSNHLSVTATGFELEGSGGGYNGSGQTYIYMAIGRPNKPASEFAATELYTAAYMTSGPPLWNSNFPVGSGWYKQRAGTGSSVYLFSRLTDGGYMQTHSTGAESSAGAGQFDFQDGWYNSNQSATTYISWMFRRAKGFFDVVAYTGNGTSTSFSHNLGATPELKIIKIRSDAFGWLVGGSAVTGGTKDYQLYLDTNAAQANTNYWGAVDSASAFSVVASNFLSNANGQTYIAYLFATVAGISKVGSYTGTGSDLNVDCGFSAGARFVLIKRTDSTGDWYLFDSLRGIVAGNDEYALLNTAAADVTNTDYIDPLSSGFTVTSSAPAGLNASSGTYIFLAIA